MGLLSQQYQQQLLLTQMVSFHLHLTGHMLHNALPCRLLLPCPFLPLRSMSKGFRQSALSQCKPPSMLLPKPW